MVLRFYPSNTITTLYNSNNASAAQYTSADGNPVCILIHGKNIRIG